MCTRNLDKRYLLGFRLFNCNSTMTYSLTELAELKDQATADYLDAMADRFNEQDEAMRESEQSQWDGVDEISSAERNACDHFNERYTYSLTD